MGLLNYSRQLVGKTTENINDVQALFNEVRAVINGQLDQSNLDPVVVQALHQTGQIVMTAAASADAGYLMCDGSAVSRTTYAALFARLGGTSSPYGQGDGSTTFNVPDLRGRVPVGVDGAANRLTANDALGLFGGEEQHVLVAGEAGVAPHGHGVSDPGHAHSNTHGAFLEVSSTISTYLNTTNNASYAVYHAPATAAAATGVAVVAHAGASGGAHNNMPPYVIVNYEIKT